jgi:prophage regulatory protein
MTACPTKCIGDAVLQTIVRFPAVKAATGLAKSTIYLRINEGLLPKPINLGRRLVGWPESEIAAVNAARIAGQTDEEIRELVKRLEADRKLLADSSKSRACSGEQSCAYNNAHLADVEAPTRYLP